MPTQTDLAHLGRAVELAGRGLGRVSPNPMVGAVVARRDEVLGEGWHEIFGGPHAEVCALRACGEADLSDATLYVSLEPCCHHGKTPPCTDAILEAGIRRVVIASDDPSAKAAGRGAGLLRDEGVEVIQATGAIASQARLLNQAFRKHALAGRPWVVFKSAMTLDGRVATGTADSRWISGEESRALVHRWRASADAVAVGIGTALADDPLLTARGPGAQRQPRRVVFDSRARLPLGSRLVASALETPLTVVVSAAADPDAVAGLQEAGAEVFESEGDDSQARLRSALEHLGARGITSLLLEGGPRLAGAFLDAGEIDAVRLFIAPVLLGASSARSPFEGTGVERISDALRALTLDCRPSGDDVLISARIREW